MIWLNTILHVYTRYAKSSKAVRRCNKPYIWLVKHLLSHSIWDQFLDTIIKKLGLSL